MVTWEVIMRFYIYEIRRECMDSDKHEHYIGNVGFQDAFKS